MKARVFCEALATEINRRNPDYPPVTGENVWCMDPNGEIWPIYALHDYLVSEGMAPLFEHLP